MSEPEILTIDVASELRKLAHGQLEGPWQVPAELARCCLAAGARSVDLQLSSRALRLWAEDCVFPQDVLGPLGVLLDATREPHERHRALLVLESHGAAGFVSLLALGASEVSFGRWGQGTRLEVRARLDAPRAAEWLRAVARFAPVPVRLEGQNVSLGFGPTLAEIPLARPLSGRLALSGEADTARVWLLLDGIVAAHMTLPSQPPFLAVIEMGPAAGGEASAAALREAIAPHLGDLVQQAVDAALDLVPMLAHRTDEEQRVLRRILLMAARRGWRTARVLAAPAIPTLARAGGAPLRLSLLDLGTSRPGTCVWAVPPGATAEDFVLPAEPVFLFTEEERGLIRDLLGVTFRTPPRRPSTPGLAALRELVASCVSRIQDLWAGLARPRPLPESALSSEERALLVALRPCADVALCAGAGRPHLMGGRWLVPRSGRTARAAARLVAADAAWTFPAALALLGGRGLPPGEAGEAWRQRS